MNSSPNRTCIGTTNAGDPCRAAAANGSLYCAFHDPQRAAERTEWRRMGGKASSTQKRLSRLIQDAEALETGDVLRLLSGGMLLLMEGKLEPSTLQALASAAKTIDAIQRTSELQRRLDELEASLSGSTRRYAG